MSNFKRLIIWIGLSSSLLCCVQVVSANDSVDYSSIDVGALQSQYQHQLKPKTPKKVISKRAAKRKQIPNNELLQYQRLLNNQQATKKPQAQRRVVNKPITRPAVRQAQKQVQPRIQQRQAIAVPQPVRAAAPRRDAIFEAASSGNVRLIGQLISQGANVNQANNERETALHMAAAKGHYSAVIYLLNHGANINARTINNWLPIHHATRFRHAQIANYLKQRGSPIHAKTSDGLSAVDMARTMNDQRILGIFGVR